MGIFGWLTLSMRPGIVYLLPILGLLILGVLGTPMNSEFRLPRRLWLLSLALTSALLVFVALYLLAARVGQEKIIGVQGRYFIPPLVLAGISVIRRAPASHRPTQAWRGGAVVAVLVVLEIAAMDATILRGFQLF